MWGLLVERFARLTMGEGFPEEGTLHIKSNFFGSLPLDCLELGCWKSCWGCGRGWRVGFPRLSWNFFHLHSCQASEWYWALLSTKVSRFSIPISTDSNLFVKLKPAAYWKKPLLEINCHVQNGYLLPIRQTSVNLCLIIIFCQLIHKTCISLILN